ncbi:unnamed protein product [Chilo suppressalis]|uniref:Sulfatase N-terminal domain-containing protein n=1 Tax=Chilo suppressalis TaxID=168631 RepID=A0ABN8BGY6_CHISP|nr:hypothetical protein evm_000611 [Chilo suppressalis]CAH0406593.1 unnamed protein product [Chilo suppressalis]
MVAQHPSFYLGFSAKISDTIYQKSFISLTELPVRRNYVKKINITVLNEGNIIKVTCFTYRIRHVKRILNMKQVKVTAGIVAVVSCFITLLLYYRYHIFTPRTQHHPIRALVRKATTRQYIKLTNLPMRHVPLNEIYPDNSEYDESHEVNDMNRRAFVETAGCEIPVAMIEYKKYKKRQKNCGKRAVFLKKVDEEYVQVMIKTRAMGKYLRKSVNFSCCYRFIRRSSHHETTKIEYTTCKRVENGEKFQLETEFVNVKCFEYNRHNVTHIVYSDVYVFIKKISIPNYQINKRKKYNVLMIGMDSMSLSRTVQAMSQTVNFFKENSWLGFRGYHKIADNTFPNLMAVFTGMNMSTISKICSNSMDECNELLLWSQFKNSGYVTAYGEDYLRLPDTFSKEYTFKSAPTDHYLRPFYIHGENELFNRSMVCTGKLPSGQHLLDYAFDFALTYRYYSFFGFFWMNSFSHNVNSHPEEADKMFESFFNRLTYTGILENTFIIFFSDHGIRFGDYRMQTASYYEERSPALFMWAPLRFQGEYPLLFRAAAVNQFRLITPYDLYNTIVNINSLSETGNSTEGASSACPNCHSLFHTISGNRTCADVEIHPKWCSCHKLYPLDSHDIEGMKSAIYASTEIKALVKKIKTERCWGCLKLAISNVIRIHFYYNDSGLYYVVAFTMTPGNITFEAVVSKKGSKLQLVGDISVISVYRGLGKCAPHQRDRLFCVCQKKENC